MKVRLSLAAALALVPSLAFAHTGVNVEHDLAHGFLHPLGGLDHEGRGVGGDGLILICPSERADARMRMFNADGSESEMCGNGLRCVAKYVHDHGIARKDRLTIETGRGILTVELEVKDVQFPKA